MRPANRLPKLIAVSLLLVCLLAAAPAAARRPSVAVISSTALDASTAKAPFLYESYWPLVLLRTPSLALWHPLVPMAVGRTPGQELLEPVRKRPNVQIFHPEQLIEPTRKTPSHQVFRPEQLIEPVRKRPSVQIFRPPQIGR